MEEVLSIKFKVLGNQNCETLDVPVDSNLETIKVLVSDFFFSLDKFIILFSDTIEYFNLIHLFNQNLMEEALSTKFNVL